VVITINNKLQNTKGKCQLCSNKTNWTYFKTILSSTLNTKFPLKNEQDLIEATEYLIQSIQEAAWQATPSAKPCIQIQPFLSDSIVKKIETKHQAKKIWQRTRFPEDKRWLNKIAKELKAMLHSHKEQELQQFLRSLEPTHPSNYSL